MTSESKRGNRPSMPATSALKAAFKLSLLLAGLTFATSARAECSREMLRGLTDTYVEAQAAGNPALLPLAAGATYGENDKARDIARGILATALPVDFTRSFHDTTRCATFTELTSASHPHPYVIHTRIEASEDGKVTGMESVVTDEDDWVFGADAHLAQTKVEDWGEIPADKRDRREVLQAAADAYIDNWGDPDLPVPHGTPCSRLEGRIFTGAKDPQGQTCTMGAFPQPIKTGNRRYVIDETVGAVSIFHDFSWIDAGLPADHPGTPASQTFRVENGMNRYIHEVTACTTPKCGR